MQDPALGNSSRPQPPYNCEVVFPTAFGLFLFVNQPPSPTEIWEDIKFLFPRDHLELNLPLQTS